MAATKTTKTAKTADTVPATFPMAMLDLAGDGSQGFAILHGLLSSAGVLIDPAKAQDIAALVTALGTPAQTADIAAVVTKNEAIRALLAGTLAVAPQASENHLGEVGGNSVVAVGSLTRQANTTAYASGQAIQQATAVSIPLTVARKNAGTGRLTRCRLTKSGASTANATFRVHLFKADPTTKPADAAAFTPSGALDYVGGFTISTARAFTDGAKGIGVPDVGPYITFDTAAGGAVLYALIEAAGAYTPVSGEVFTVALEADRD